MDLISIYNLLGEKVLEIKASNTVDMSRFAKDMYTIIFSEKKNRVVKKAVL